VDSVRFAPQRRTPGPQAVLYVGRLAPEKNLPLLIRASQRAGLRLLVVGDGPERGALEELAMREDADVRFLGVQPHEVLPTACAQADIFALPSLTEGSPKALLEAMAVGLPCVASHAAAEAIGASPWAVLAASPVVDSRHQLGLRDALEAVLAGDARATAFGAAGRSHVEARHDLKKTLSAEVDFVHNAVEAHGQQARQA